MKSSVPEVAAVAAAEAAAKKQAEETAKQLTPEELDGRHERAKKMWHSATSVIVPAWFGQNSVKDGLKLSQTFTPAGVLALVAVGTSRHREFRDSDKGGESEVGMQISLRPSGFDRQEARDLAEVGFWQLRHHKLVKEVKGQQDAEPDMKNFQLTAKGQKWFDCMQRSMGCAEPKPAVAA